MNAATLHETTAIALEVTDEEGAKEAQVLAEPS